jgi:serine protease Do
MHRFDKLGGAAKAACVVALAVAFTGALVLLAAEKAEQGFLGVSVQRLGGDEREKLGVSYGVQVVGVEKESAAAKAGIKEDDVIQTVNGEKIRDAQALSDVVRDLAPGSAVRIGLWRDGKALEVKAVLGKLEPRQRVYKLEGPLFKYFRQKPYLGVNLFEPDEDLAAYFAVKPGEGVLVTRVEKETPAAKAGMKSGDVIVEMGGKAVKESDDILNALAGLKPGDSVAITVVRHGKRETLKAEPDFSRRERVMQIIRSGKGDEIGHLRLPDLDIEIPEAELAPPCPPEPPDVDAVLRKVDERLERARIRIDKHLKWIGEDSWI